MANTEIRRKDRIMSDDDAIRSFIRSSASGIFGFADNDVPYLNPNLYIYSENENCIYFHTAGPSTVKEIIQKNPQATFVIYEMGRLLPGPRAVDLSVEYTSVVISGAVEIVTDHEKIVSVFQSYIEKYFPELKPGSFTPFTIEDALKATMYKLTIGRITAKQNRKPDDYPGALFYEDKRGLH
jgi:nitroimidazol reductase NimA-like FMN-containing flavoprotein (pyridoxamine 5'-phosphate oxidase superfamily)